MKPTRASVLDGLTTLHNLFGSGVLIPASLRVRGDTGYIKRTIRDSLTGAPIDQYTHFMLEPYTEPIPGSRGRVLRYLGESIGI